MIIRRVATVEKGRLSRFHRVANATRKYLDDLIPALKGRAKFITTLRVALF
jgi:hypothetical protein